MTIPKLNCSQFREQFENILFGVLSLILIALPLGVDVWAFLTFEPIKVHLLLIGAGLILALLILGTGSGYPLRSRLTHLYGVHMRWAFLGFFLSLGLATALSLAPFVSFWGIDPRYHGLLYYSALLTLLLGTSLLRPHRYKSLLEMVMFTSVAVSVFGILQRIIPGLNQWWDVSSFLYRTYSTLGHPNYLADFLVLTTPLFFWKFLTSQRWYVWLMLGSITFLALLLTLSRSGLLGILASLFFFLAVYSYWSSRKRIFGLFMIVPLILGLLILYANVVYRDNFVNSQNLLARFVIAGENLRSFETRLSLWPATWKLILERPLLGYGPDTFPLAFTQVAPPELLKSEGLNSYADRAHNLMLDTLVEVGFIGLFFWVVIFVLSLVSAVKSRNILVLSLGSSLFGHFISQQFGFQTTPHAALMWVFLAGIFLLQAGEQSASWSSRSRRTCVIGITIAFVVMITTMSVSIPQWRSDRIAREAYGSLEYLAAYEVAPSRTYYLLLSVLSDLQNQELGLSDPSTSMEIVPAMLERLAILERTTNGYDYRVFLYRARVYALRSRYEEAYADFDHALALYPYGPRIHFWYGKVLYQAGEYARALERWRYYLGLVPDYWKHHEAYQNGTLSAWERNRYEVFYKLNPDFDEVLDLIRQAEDRLQTES